MNLVMKRMKDEAKSVFLKNLAGLTSNKTLDSETVTPRDLKESISRLALEALDDWRPPQHLEHKETMLQVVDFFSGCGGMTLGFDALSRVLPGIRILGGCDIDPEACSSYEKNFSAACQVADVRTFLTNGNKWTDFVNGLDVSEDAPLLVIGCPPCQGFTSHRKKNWATSDDRNSLVEVFARLAVRLEPECIVMENVPEMLAEKYWDHFEEARSIFEDHGFTVRQAIYNSAEFGVPQERFRAIVIAMRKQFLLPYPLYDVDEFKTVRDAIGHLPPVDPGTYPAFDPLHRSARHRKSTIETIRSVPPNGGSRPKGVGPECLDKVNGFSDVYGRLFWDRPAITITHYARNPASGRYVHPEQDRGLTMREAALLQSFPDHFDFNGSFDGVFKQIGEAVPPRLSSAIAANVVVELFSAPPTEEEIRDGYNLVTEPVSNSYSSVIAGLKQSRR